jgi:cytochrome c biogenesis protein CcdA
LPDDTCCSPAPLIKVNGKHSMMAWKYLLLYNFMFTIPLVIIFILTYFGLKTQTLLEWSKKNVVISKILLGILFLAMAVLICVI